MSKRHEALFNSITGKIIDLLEKVNIEDFEAPFAGLAANGLPTNPTTGNRYNGVNIPCLWFYQQEKGYSSNQWATYKQWKAQNAQVIKGEKESPIIYFKTLKATQENDRGDSEEISIPMLKLYTVFNANQVEGFKENDKLENEENSSVSNIDLVDEFCRNTKAEIRNCANRAFYNLESDSINIPNVSEFKTTKDRTPTENYYSVLLHELTHWTGAKHRLDRFTSETISEKHNYAFEELVAELGSAFLCAQFEIAQTSRECHAKYIKGWLTALKNDNRYIFKASAQAARSATYLKSLQPTMD